MKSYFIIIIFSYSLHAQNLFKVKPKYNSSNLKLLNEWVFQSMKTITYAENEESETIFKDDKNQETIKFKKSGEIIYFSDFDGRRNTGTGNWLIKDDSLSIITNGDTINASYKIFNNILSIITVDKETDEFYGFKTIMEYIPKGH